MSPRAELRWRWIAAVSTAAVAAAFVFVTAANHRPPPEQQTTTTTSATPTTTTTTAPLQYTAPLTGEVLDDDLSGRRAVVVKVDASPRATPQRGVNSADVVFEVRAEGLSRYAAVFHSRIPDVVGPVRSARTVDALLWPMLEDPILVFSGSNPGTAAALENSGLALERHVRNNDVWFRDPARRMPHNLYATLPQVLATSPPAQAPPPLFTYTNLPLVGTPATRVDAAVYQPVAFTYNAASARYERDVFAAPHLDDTGERVTAANVVVLQVDHSVSPADPVSPEAVVVGNGAAWVLSSGVLRTGTWSRTAPTEPFALTDGSGELQLTPGSTWVLLVEEPPVVS